jgi:patatin-like phospholipase/acyl hydrolase
MARFRIIALDGGQNLLAGIVLKRLEQARPGFLEHGDVYAGTSAGAMLALLMASSEDPASEIDYYNVFWDDPSAFQ